MAGKTGKFGGKAEPKKEIPRVHLREEAGDVLTPMYRNTLKKQ